MGTLTYQHYYVRAPVTSRITKVLDGSSNKDFSFTDKSIPELSYSVESSDDPPFFEEDKKEVS